jgi:hypothetical protein
VLSTNGSAGNIANGGKIFAVSSQNFYKKTEQDNTEPVVKSCDTEYISKSKDGRNGAGKKLLNNISALQDNILDYKSDIDGLLSVLHTIKNR